MKKQTKKNIVNYGLKVAVVLGTIGAISSISKENTVVNKVVLVAVTALVGGAQYIIVDEMVKVLFDEQNSIKSKRNLRLYILFLLFSRRKNKAYNES